MKKSAKAKGVIGNSRSSCAPDGHTGTLDSFQNQNGTQEFENTTINSGKNAGASNWNHHGSNSGTPSSISGTVSSFNCKGGTQKLTGVTINSGANSGTYEAEGHYKLKDPAGASLVKDELVTPGVQMAKKAESKETNLRRSLLLKGTNGGMKDFFAEGDYKLKDLAGASLVKDELVTPGDQMAKKAESKETNLRRSLPLKGTNGGMKDFFVFLVFLLPLFVYLFLFL